MQALRVHEQGELRFESAPDPKVGAGEVLVELRAAALNRRDTFVRQGLPLRHVGPFPFPLVPGADGAGTRRDTGEEVILLPSVDWGPEDTPGDDFQILGGARDGTHAELIAVPAANVFPKPERLTWTQAAALPLAGLTAYRALFTRGQLRAGETVLVLGAGGGVATFAIQLAAQAGARVLVTSSTREKIDHAISLGAADGVLYTDPSWADAIRELADGRGVDLVLDSVGSTCAESLHATRRGGRVVVLGGTGGATVELDLRSFYHEHLTLVGTAMGGPDEFAALLEAVASGTWVPVIDTVYPLEQGVDAYDRLASGTQFGKLVLACQ